MVEEETFDTVWLVEPPFEKIKPQVVVQGPHILFLEIGKFTQMRPHTELEVSFPAMHAYFTHFETAAGVLSAVVNTGFELA